MVSAVAGDFVRLFIQLLPFLYSSFIAFAYVPSHDDPTVLTIILKCLPLTTLVYLVKHVPPEEKFKYDSDNQSNKSVNQKLIYDDRNILRKNMVHGLAFSVIGDAAMTCHDNYYMFLCGVIFFTFAQICYIRSFGWVPLDPAVGVFAYMVAGIMSFIVFQYIDFVNQIIMTTYSIMLATMTWRTVARFEVIDSGAWWQKWCLIFGALMFCVCDITIAIFNFKIEATPFEAQSMILSTYYIAQFLLVLGII